jgi:hypothetical protein
MLQCVVKQHFSKRHVWQEQSSACCLLCDGFLLAFFLDNGDEGDMFLRNVG